MRYSKFVGKKIKKGINGNILNLKISIIDYYYLYYNSKLTLFQSCNIVMLCYNAQIWVLFNKTKTKQFIEEKQNQY